MKKIIRTAALVAAAPWALLAATSPGVAQVRSPLPEGAVPLPDAPEAPGRVAPRPETVLPRGDTVATRARPELDPLGIRAGAFLVFPELTIEEIYNDNIFAENGDETDDFITSLRPEVTVESNWSRHALAIAGGGDFGFYAQNSDENYQDWFAATNGRFDVSRDVGAVPRWRRSPAPRGARHVGGYGRLRAHRLLRRTTLSAGTTTTSTASA